MDKKTTLFRNLPVGTHFVYPVRPGDVLRKTGDFHSIGQPNARYISDDFGIVVWPDEGVVQVECEEVCDDV